MAKESESKIEEVEVVEVEVVGAEEAPAVEAETQAEDAGAQQQSKMGEIPVFGKCDPKTQARLEEICKGTNVLDRDAAVTFGDEASAGLNQITEELIQILHDDKRKGILARAAETMEEAAENKDIGMIMEAMKRNVKETAAKLGSTAKENKGLMKKIGGVAATGGALMLTGPIGAGATALAVMGAGPAKRYLAKKETEKEIALLSQDPEKLEIATRKAIDDMRNKQEAVQEAYGEAPKLTEQITELYKSYMYAFLDTTIYIGAGNEIMRVLKEEAIPEMESDPLLHTDVEKMNQLENLQEFAMIMDRKLGALNMTLVDAGRAGISLKNLRRSMTEVQLNLSVAVTTGATQAQGAIAEQLVANEANTQALAVVDANRAADAMLQMTADTQDHIAGLTTAGRYDNSERMGQRLQLLERMQKNMITSAENARVEEGKIEESRQDLMKSLNAVRETQNKIAAGEELPALTTGAKTETAVSPVVKMSIDEPAVKTDVKPKAEFQSIMSGNTPANDDAGEVPLKPAKGKVVNEPKNG